MPTEHLPGRTAAGHERPRGRPRPDVPPGPPIDLPLGAPLPLRWNTDMQVPKSIGPPAKPVVPRAPRPSYAPPGKPIPDKPLIEYIKERQKQKGKDNKGFTIDYRQGRTFDPLLRQP
ncbi:hypothetical protein M011DRAFT_22220 [Sporormia fimetaria CBS 119925]|uniref:Uncharacterized protein n=1 Tax=Sporormia fimetaria CBS 119925 TaxID=1340428 RepID=A0A6A6VRC4_9PLEO|nr:hypothetical protein M011DRAFT_22220 [Sporormia fimetaria CBS 119925]